MPVPNNFSGGVLPANYSPNKYAELGNSIGKIAYQIIREVLAENPLAVFDKQPVNKGDTIEQAIIKLVEAQGYDRTGAGTLARNTDEKMIVRYFNNWKRQTYDTTVDVSEIRKIISEDIKEEDVAARLVSVLSQSDIYDKFTTTKALLKWGTTNNALVNVGTVSPVAGATGLNYKGILQKIRDVVDGMKFVNGDYNTAGILRATRNEDIYILAPFNVLNAIDVNDLAGVFNLSKAEIESKLIKLDTTDNIIYIVDQNAMQIITRLYEMAPPQINSKGLFYNYFLHVERLYALSPLFDACYFEATEAAPEPAYYTVTFDSDGGTPVPEQIVKPNGFATSPVPQPTKTGSDFDGWADSTGNNFTFQTTPITADITLTAKWI